MTSGFFIALEGPDGSGKTTQAARLVSWLKTLYPQVVACRDPGGTGLGDRLRSILLERSTTTIGMRAEMLLYMASRAQLVEEVVAPALERGAIVVTDRYVLSNVVYQGFAGGIALDQVWEVGRAATGGLLPDLTLLIDVPPDVASGRVGPGRDRIEDRGDDYRRKVRQGYLDAVNSLSSSHRVIDGSLDADEVELRIQNEVKIALGIGPRT